MLNNTIHIYTDASTNPKTQQGAWAALLLHESPPIILKGQVSNTTNNRLELWAVLQGIAYLKAQNIPYDRIRIHTDSQYVIRLSERKDRLKATNFHNKKEQPLPNIDLLKLMIAYIETEPLEWVKIKAHLKKSEANPHHRKVDRLVRKVLRHGEGE